MNILNKIRNFGSSMVSGIGRVFNTSPTPSVFNAPGSPAYGPQQPNPVYQSISDSVFSSIADWINPNDSPPPQAPQPQPQVMFLPSGGDSSEATGSNDKIFGIPQVTLLVVLGGVAAFLILKRS